ncbi:MAG: hypothetical protein N3D11_13410, partial [Candidatus Sumerlaeia bacterium]|nr:hypothetical protein [Candidatus Sumerlaeia bacterium]
MAAAVVSAPFQGFKTGGPTFPKALPWAGLVRPFRAKKSKLLTLALATSKEVKGKRVEVRKDHRELAGCLDRRVELWYVFRQTFGVRQPCCRFALR